MEATKICFAHFNCLDTFSCAFGVAPPGIDLTVVCSLVDCDVEAHLLPLVICAAASSTTQDQDTNQHNAWMQETNSSGIAVDNDTNNRSTSPRILPIRSPSETDEAFAHKCFPHPHQAPHRSQLLNLFQQPWFQLDLLEPMGSLQWLLIDVGLGRRQCLICSKPLGRIGRALEHVRSHLAYKPFWCVGRSTGCSLDSCGKNFHSQEALKEHQRRTYKECDICRSIVLSKNFGRHQRTHQAARL
ncbi:hypothetical protein FRC19_005512 [Serendipita sp. 401]|nr:hypothetical protein FRC19_005512 [Serendipita sp. 401]